MNFRETFLPLFAAALFSCASTDPSPPSAAASQTQSQSPSESPTPEARLAAIRKGIVRSGGSHIAVDRGTLDEILEHQPELMSQSRIVPEVEKGKVIGIRFFGAPPDSLLGLLGFQDGDRLQTVNGLDITVQDKALTVLADLRHTRHLSVVLNRGGQDLTLEYDIT